MMRAAIYSVVFIAMVLLMIDDSNAQNRFVSFTINDTLQFVPKSPGEMPRQYLQLTPELLNSSNVAIGDVIIYEYDAEAYEFTVKKVVSYVPNTYTYVAKSGLRYFYYTVSGDIVTAAIHLPDIGHEAVVYHDPAYKMSYLQEHDHTDELSCGNHALPGIVLDQIDSRTGSAKVNNAYDLVNKMQSVENETTIKLMIVYANGALNWMQTFGSVENVINQAMALSQEALDVSDTRVRLELAHVGHVNHQEAGTGGSILLNQLRINGDGIMDEVHSWRNTFEADIVSLFAVLNDVGGVGYLPSSPAGDDRLGFNANRVQQMTNTYTLIHEIGHNMGNMHSRNQASAAAGFNGGVFPYSTGWRWIGFDNVSYASVMTYESSPLDGVNSIRTPHFSNPSITYQGVPTGTSSASDPFGPADNARSMREMKAVIAAYRPRAVVNDVPLITSATPSWGARGSSVSVVFRGVNINMISNFSWACPSGGAMQATSATINSPTQLTVNWNISITAAPGVCNLQFWTGQVNNSLSTPSQFTITEVPITAPELITTSAYNLRPSAAFVGGSVTYDGGAEVTARGVCLSTSQNPGLDDICVSAGTGDGIFVSEFDGLTPATLYYVRAYATNLAGTAFGQQLSFTTTTPVLNKAPTLESILGVTVTAVEAFELEIPLAGISFGDDEDDQEISITAKSSDPDLLELEVEYVSPQPNGLLRVRGHGSRVGTATVTVTVKDNGGTSYGGVDSLQVKFPVEVQMGTSIDVASDKPSEFKLYQNYPNPFNPSTQISFDLPVASKVELMVYDLMGRKIMQLLDETKPAGRHSIALDAKSLPSGIYMYVIRAGGFTASNKMTLIK